MKLLASVSAFAPPSGGVAPPGVENVTTIVQWGMWAASAVLFGYFVLGLVQAAQARQRGGQADASAPVWPLVLAIVLGAASTIWMAIA